MRAARQLRKYRLEGETLGVSVEEDLEDGESLNGAPAVRILRLSDGGLEDATDEFGVTDEQYATVTLPNGDSHRSVLFTTTAAAEETHQAPGAYYIEAKYSTDTGRTPVRHGSAGPIPLPQLNVFG